MQLEELHLWSFLLEPEISATRQPHANELVFCVVRIHSPNPKFALKPAY